MHEMRSMMLKNEGVRALKFDSYPVLHHPRELGA